MGCIWEFRCMLLVRRKDYWPLHFLSISLPVLLLQLGHAPGTPPLPVIPRLGMSDDLQNCFEDVEGFKHMSE